MGPTHFRKATLADLPRFEESLLPDTGVPDIALRRESSAVVWMALFSGALSTVAAWQLNNLPLFYLGPGTLFGLLVLLPWCRSCGVSWLQTLAAAGLAPLGYAAAVALTLNFSIYSLAAGLVGSAIMFAPILVRCHRRARLALLNAGAAGATLGMVVPVFALVGGIAAWQMAVACCLSRALVVEED